jgi:hypothetical protein
MLQYLKEGDPITVTRRIETGVTEDDGEFAGLVYDESGQVWFEYYLHTMRDAATDVRTGDKPPVGPTLVRFPILLPPASFGVAGRQAEAR